jgi:RNA polymerase sigma-70 factor (ECF subfamily)
MRGRSLERHFATFRERGDGAALAAVFDRTSEELLQVACHLVRDPSLAEDVVQATFLAAIRHADRYDGVSPLQGWLYGILWREAAKVRRGSAREVDPAQLVSREEEDPADSLAAAELPREVVRALERLPNRYREVVEPHLCDGRSPGDIARELGRSPGTVRSQIHRGLERLRRTLPAGLTPVPAMFALRGLGSVRESVLSSAGVSQSVATAAALAPAAGGALAFKGLAVAGGVGVLALAGTWGLHGNPFTRPSIEAASGLAFPKGSEIAGLHASVASVDSEVGDAAAPSEERSAVQPAPEPEPKPELTFEFWIARFGEGEPQDWRHGLAIAYEIAELPPDDALRIMSGVWPHLSVPVKEQVLKPFVFGGHEHALKVLHLAATDEALTVQGRSFGYLRSYAFRDFSTDYEAYLRWADAAQGRPLAEVISTSAREVVQELLTLSAPELAARMAALDRLDFEAGLEAGVDVAEVMRQAGGLRVLETCLLDPDPELRGKAIDWSKSMGAGEPWLRTWVLPSIEQPDTVEPQVLDNCLRALGRPDCTWARDPIVAYLKRIPASEEGLAMSAAGALADMGDLRAIPALIEVLLADREGVLTYEVGYFGLAKLTGVNWQETYDGAWWLDWWEKNHRRLPPEVQAMTIEH